MNIKIRILGILFLTSITYTFSVYGQSVEWRKKAHEVVAAGWDTLPLILKNITPPTFANRDFVITSYGAVSDGTTKNTKAFAAAIAACTKAGGGRVIVPAGGAYLTGAIHLDNNVNLHLESGAIIKFSTDPCDYLPLVYTRWEGHEYMGYSPLIYAWKKTNIAITGNGTLDGQGSTTAWWPWKNREKFGWKKGDPSQADADNVPALYQMGEDGVPVEKRIFGEGHYLRPSFIQPYNSKNILIDGIKIVRSPNWIIHPVLCTNVTITNVNVESLGPNNDGCNPESCNYVLIKNCTFDTGDDCISPKAGKNRDGRRVGVPASNYVIQNCNFKAGHGGLVIGSETSGGIHNIYMEDCTFNSPDLLKVLRIKTNSNRGGFVEHIYLRNSTVLRAQIGVSINFYYQEGDVGQFDPVVRNIYIEDVDFKKVDQAFNIKAYERSPVKSLIVKNCQFSDIKKENNVSKGTDLRLIRVTQVGLEVE